MKKGGAVISIKDFNTKTIKWNCLSHWVLYIQLHVTFRICFLALFSWVTELLQIFSSFEIFANHFTAFTMRTSFCVFQVFGGKRDTNANCVRACPIVRTPRYAVYMTCAPATGLNLRNPLQVAFRKSRGICYSSDS